MDLRIWGERGLAVFFELKICTFWPRIKDWPNVMQNQVWKKFYSSIWGRNLQIFTPNEAPVHSFQWIFFKFILDFLYFIFRRLRGWWWCEVHLLVCVHNYNWLSKFSKFQDWFEQGERSLDSMTAIKRNQDDKKYLCLKKLNFSLEWYNIYLYTLNFQSKSIV